jgi:CYTH domain-containing protein
MRYQYLVRKTIAEIDIFQDHLKGLILIDFEFETIEEKKSFIVPDFCLWGGPIWISRNIYKKLDMLKSSYGRD